MRRNRATAERAASPVSSIVISVLLHAGLIAVLFLSFSKKLDIVPDAAIVPVDLVTLADQTNVAPMVKKEDLTPPDVHEQEPEPTPEVAPPKFDVAPEAKPVPEKKPEKKTDAEKFDINDIEKLLAKKKPANAKVGDRTVQGVGAGTAMTADLRSLLRSQINRCWRRPDFGPNPARLVVQFRLYLGRDGKVAQPPELVSQQGDSYMRAAADTARRAIYGCAPYQLPPDKYNLWRDSVVTFTPQDPYNQ
jgi:hypothetical protein